jgi:hypothetical protein
MVENVKDYSMYRYYRGEDENPFSIILDKAEIKTLLKILLNP